MLGPITTRYPPFSMGAPSDHKADAQEFIENALPPDPHLAHFPLLQAKTAEQLDALNKSVVRKLDWTFLPVVTMMLLMKYVPTLSCTAPTT